MIMILNVDVMVCSVVCCTQELEELLSTSDCSPPVSLSDLGLLAEDLDAYIKEEPSFDAAITSRTGREGMITRSF